MRSLARPGMQKSSNSVSNGWLSVTRGRNDVAYIKLRIAERAEENPRPTTPEAFRPKINEGTGHLSTFPKKYNFLNTKTNRARVGQPLARPEKHFHLNGAANETDLR